jgi:hypothetical protein
MNKIKIIIQNIKEISTKHFFLILSLLAFLLLGKHGTIIHSFFTSWLFFMWIFSIYQNQILMLLNKYIIRVFCLFSLAFGATFFTIGYSYHATNLLTLGVIFLISSVLLLIADLIINKKNNGIKS